MYSRFCLRLIASLSLLSTPSFARAAQDIRLLECLPNGVCVIPTSNQGPLGVFGYYFNSMYPYVVGLSAGIAVLWALWGGIEMIMSGGDPGKRQEGINRMLHSVMGLLLIIFAAFIMNFINPTFFQ
jgi:hypothetical protein